MGIGGPMADLRIEARKDEASGMWCAELYYPEARVSPIACTRPIFDSSDHALVAALRAMKKAVERALL